MTLLCSIQQALQLAVVGPPQTFNAVGGIGMADLSVINRAAIGDHAWNHPKARGNTRVMPLTANAFDQGRVKLLARPVEIQIGARRTSHEKGRTKFRS